MRRSMPMMLLLMLTLVCQGAVARIHVMASPSPHAGGHSVHGSHHRVDHDLPRDCHASPCHGADHFCDGDCGNCRILISPTSLVSPQIRMAITRHSAPEAPPPGHFDSRPPDRALRPPIGQLHA